MCCGPCPQAKQRWWVHDRWCERSRGKPSHWSDLALDVGAMQEAAQLLVGTHDYSAFMDVRRPAGGAGGVCLPLRCNCLAPQQNRHMRSSTPTAPEHAAWHPNSAGTCGLAPQQHRHNSAGTPACRRAPGLAPQQRRPPPPLAAMLQAWAP